MYHSMWEPPQDLKCPLWFHHAIPNPSSQNTQTQGKLFHHKIENIIVISIDHIVCNINFDKKKKSANS